MVEAHFIPYNDENHRAPFLKLLVEYGVWLANEVSTRYDINLVPPGYTTEQAAREYMENVLPNYTAMKPPEGIIYILEVDGEAAGMGILRKNEDGVGEIKRMFTRPEFRGNGYGQEMLRKLEGTAEEFGYSTLRLDTRVDAAAAGE